MANYRWTREKRALILPVRRTQSQQFMGKTRLFDGPHAFRRLVSDHGVRGLGTKTWLGVRWRAEFYGKRVKRRVLCFVAPAYRRFLLGNVVFIGVTGSCGKTTTKELITEILRTGYTGTKSRGNWNLPWEVAETLLSVKPRDAFCVQEISVGIKGEPYVRSSARLVKPKIAIVTNIGADHSSGFESLDEIAKEKGQLVSAVPHDGIVILNADDPRVLAMRKIARGKVITYGTGEDAELRANNVQCEWPKTLSFSLDCMGQTWHINTRMCGEHWVYVVLAAIATGLAMSIPMKRIAEVLERAPAFDGRLSPVMRSDGVTFIRDDFKAPLWTVPPALTVLKNASASRKIAVIGTLSDYRGDAARQYTNVARQALEAADYVFFVGQWASRCLRARRYPNDDVLRAFSNVNDLKKFMKGFLRPGDLVLLKGRERLDGLRQLVESTRAHSDTEDSSDEDLVAAKDPGQPLTEVHPDGLDERSRPETPVRIVVGLGNPGERYRNTRHNVGRKVVEMMAVSHGADWEQLENAMVATINHEGGTTYLVTSLAPINSSGDVLKKLMSVVKFSPPECVLVFDDMDLPIGKVRFRSKGSAGGHNGVRAIINAFQSEDFKRIKIGIGRPGSKKKTVSYVLGEFSTSEQVKIDEALRHAKKRVLALTHSPFARKA